MKNEIEKFRKQKTENAKKAAAAEVNLNGLKENISTLENQIEAAIAEGDLETAEKLVRDRRDLDVKLEIAQKTIAILRNQPLNREKVASAWNTDCNDYQKQIDKAENDLRQSVRQLVEKAIAAAVLVNTARNSRCEMLELVDDQEPYTLNTGNSDFNAISFNGDFAKKIIELLDASELAQIRPDAMEEINEAARRMENPFFRKND